MLLNFYWLSREEGKHQSKHLLPFHGLSIPSTCVGPRLCDLLSPPARHRLTLRVPPSVSGEVQSLVLPRVERNPAFPLWDRQQASTGTNRECFEPLRLHNLSLDLSPRFVECGVNVLIADLFPCSRTAPDFLQHPTMRSGLGLCVLGLLCLNSLVSGQVRTASDYLRWDDMVWSGYHKPSTSSQNTQSDQYMELNVYIHIDTNVISISHLKCFIYFILLLN